MTAQEDLDLLRRRVVNVIGHELRTPVTTVRGLAESLVEAADEHTRSEIADALVRSAVRLERLVDDLLLASGVFTASPVGDAVDVDLADAVRRAGWPAAIEGRATALAHVGAVDRILEPIVDNARRHGEPLEVRLGGADDCAVIDVESTGPELGEGDVALLCEPFFRGEQAVMTAPGLGLGLAIARTIARAEGGDVHAHARGGGGLVVRIELPRRLLTVRVLIVDDEEDIRVLLRNQLEHAGYEVAGEAADGVAGLALCESQKPDAVILDLLMPIMNGFEVIPKLKTKYPKIGIVAYTAVAGDFVRQEMTRMGIPLVLKSGAFTRLDSVLRELAATTES